MGGARYFLSFLDDFSNMAFLYFLNSKDQVLDNFKAFKNLMENQSNQKIKILRTDNGREFYGTNFNNFLIKRGILTSAKWFGRKVK